MWFHTASLGLPILICIGAWQMAGAQPSEPTIRETPTMSVEEIVGNLVRRNLERSRALAAYQGTRTYRLEYHGFPGTRTAEMVVDVGYKAPSSKEFTVRSETGSKLVIERVFKRMLQSEREAVTEENQRAVALIPDNYTFSLVEKNKLLAVPPTFSPLSLAPRTSSYIADESGSMRWILLSRKSKESLPRILPSGRKKRKLNRFTRR